MAGVRQVRLGAGWVRVATPGVAASRMVLDAPVGENRPVGRTILIVDDHPSFRASARRMLEADGYEVVGEAADGRSAIRAVHELRPDVVLLDIRLPDVDGFEVAERLAANGAAPAIVLTSSRDRSDFEYEIVACPAHGFVPKSDLSAEAITLLIR
jgi:DNA-binding NarL/FixJ family response regulator